MPRGHKIKVLHTSKYLMLEKKWQQIFNLFILLFKIYLLVLQREKKRERETERVEGRDRRRESSSGLLTERGDDLGLDLRMLRSLPELKPRVRDLTNWATQAPSFFSIVIILVFSFPFLSLL